MKSIFENHFPLWLAAACVLNRSQEALANPTGLTIGGGTATAQQIGSQLNVSVSQTAILNWQTFNIGIGETTSFLQPSANSVAFNIIGDRNPSQIFGNLNANGTVILANANGFYFGPDSMIKVGGSFIATTAPLPPDFGASGMWNFTGIPPSASIINYGQIEVGQGRSLYLIAEKIENHGSLNAPAGDIELTAGSEVLVSQSADGRGLSARVKLPEGTVDNFGRITADAGTIALQARVVNQNGILQADSLAEKNGIVELVASDAVNLGADSQILARGDNSYAGSAGGNVVIKSENSFSDADGSSIVTTGGVHGGNGGDVEVSAINIESLNTAMDARAQSGFTGGEFLLDPVNILLGTSGNSTVPNSGTVGYSSGGTLNLNVNTAFANKNFSNIKLQASQNITIAANTTWDLSGSTGVTLGQLTLQAGGDIIFNSNSKITDANGWGVSLFAGYDFVNSSLKPGIGNIYFNGGSGRTLNGAISTAAGNIDLNAGNGIFVGTGYVRTSGGGNISALALSGDISTGTLASGTLNSGYDYSFNINGNNPTFANGYKVTDNLGGISTKAGGNVSLVAGGSINPASRATTFGISGAFGSQAGDVTLVAGSLVEGNFNIANGKGTILSGVNLVGGQPQISSAGADAGSTLVPLTLGLISGSWNIYAAHDVYLNEIYNPNGTFNSQNVSVDLSKGYSANTDGTGVPTQTKFLNNYAADAALNIWAGNLIDLIGGNLKRPGGYPSTVSLPIYAPELSLNAGAGGILIEKSIILAPSSKGSLNITTRDGGDLIGASVENNLLGIIMSDSGVPKIETFDQGHATSPWHLNDANPVTLDIDGSIKNFALTVPTFAEIDVAKDTYNFGFIGRNLSASQTSYIHVGGDISYRGNLTPLSLTDEQAADPLPSEMFTASADPSITSKLFYDKATGKLVYFGVMSEADKNFLKSPVVLVLDAQGNPIEEPVLDANGHQALDENGNALFQLKTKNLTLDDTQKGIIDALFAATQDASLGDHGLALAGLGKFDIRAQNIDLGVSGGIKVMAPDSALASISPVGAELDVTTIGYLSMTSTKIANESYLGGINLNVGGTLDVGSQFTTLGDPDSPKGIFTSSSGNISIIAQNDVNVNGSRIAAYNGGNIFVKSLTGDVNAGKGGSGYVAVNALEIDPITGALVPVDGKIPGSGIIATTLFGSHAELGNVTIAAPKGNVNANLGGVLQIAFNGADSANKFIQIDAGKDINASGSGIIGSNIKLAAGGDIKGVIIGSQSIAINSQQNVDVTAVSGGSVNIGASGSVSGTVIGGGDVSVSGETIDAAVLGGSVSTSGDTSSASLGVPASNVTQENAVTADNAQSATEQTSGDNDELNKKKKGIVLAQKVSRVTVLLPAKN